MSADRVLALFPARDGAAEAPQWNPPWVAPFLFVVAAIAEFMSVLLMTMLRYGNQRLEPRLFDLSQSADLFGFLLSLPFILLFLTMAVVGRLHRVRLAVTAVTVSCAGVVALTLVPLLSAESRLNIYIGYLAVKAVEFALFTVLLIWGSKALWKKITAIGLLSITLATAVLVVVVATVLVTPIGAQIEELPRRQYDAAVILGAAVWSGNRPSPVLRERINRGFDLLKDELVQFIVVTGGNAPSELPEAEVARLELIKLGADPTRIVEETSTNSTVEQVIYIREQLIQKQKWDSFIIVSDQFHLKRALEICSFNGIDARGISSESPLGAQNLAFYHLRESAALILYWMFGA